MAYIYTLSDSTGIRYVGKTNNIKVRFKDHINTSKRVNRPNNYRSNWILSLINKGESPIIEVIDTVPDDEWIFWEIYWISQFKSWGFDLVNTTLGGENPPSFAGKTHSDEYKEIRRNKMLLNNPAKNMNDEWKNNISKSLKGRVFTKEHTLKLGKSVCQLSLDGKFIKKWDSITIASNKLSINYSGISGCVRGKRNKAGNFKWKYYER